MSTFDNAVSIHPYFTIREGQLEAVKSLLPEFTRRVVNEDKCLYYNFTLKDDTLCCREAYRGAEGVQAHLENVGEQLGQLMEIAELTRLELHGPAEELELLKEALENLNPEYFVLQTGIGT